MRAKCIAGHDLGGSLLTNAMFIGRLPFTRWSIWLFDHYYQKKYSDGLFSQYDFSPIGKAKPYLKVTWEMTPLLNRFLKRKLVQNSSEQWPYGETDGRRLGICFRNCVLMQPDLKYIFRLIRSLLPQNIWQTVIGTDERRKITATEQSTVRVGSVNQCKTAQAKNIFCLFPGHCHRSRNEEIDKRARRKLIIASILCVVFMIAEIVGKFIMRFGINQKNLKFRPSSGWTDPAAFLLNSVDNRHQLLIISNSYCVTVKNQENIMCALRA